MKGQSFTYLAIFILLLFVSVSIATFYFKSIHEVEQSVERMASEAAEGLKKSIESVCIITTQYIENSKDTEELFHEILERLYEFLSYAKLDKRVDIVFIENVNPSTLSCKIQFWYIPMYDLVIEHKIKEFFETPSKRIIIPIHPILSFTPTLQYAPSPLLPKYFGYTYPRAHELQSFIFYKYKGDVYLSQDVYGIPTYKIDSYVNVYKLRSIRGSPLAYFYPLEEQKEVQYPLLIKYVYKDKIVLVPLVPLKYFSYEDIRYLLYIALYKEIYHDV